MTPDKTLSEMIRVKIQIENVESNIQSAKRYYNEQVNSDKDMIPTIIDINTKTKEADQLKARFNELLATLQPY